MMTPIRGVVASLAAILASCATSHTASASDAAFFRQFDRKVFPVAGSTMSNLPPHRRSEIRLIQSVLKPEYRTRLTYTYSNDGFFVVFLPYGNGDFRTAAGFIVNGCSTPREPRTCVHECGLAFHVQFWTAGAFMGDHCEDDAPVWLHPRRPLPQFESSGPPGAESTP